MKLHKSISSILIIILLISCQSMKDLTVTNVHTRQVEYKVAGQGTTTVVLETGMGPTLDTWSPIFDSISTHHAVFAYNRPGYGRSSLDQAPKTVTQVAQQLRENLRSAGIAPPYILVGHSAGGLYINMFARLFPDEVRGMVFLDASHPKQFQYFHDEHPLLYNMLITSTRKGNRKYEEFVVKNTFGEFSTAPPFPNIPIAVLTAGKKSSFLESDKLRKQWLIFQEDLATLSENARHLVVDGSGHYIHKDRPEVVLQELERIISSEY